MQNTFISKIRTWSGWLDLPLLLFILTMSQDRIVLKLAALVFIFALRFNFKFGLRQNRLPLFYLIIIALEILKYFFMMDLYLGNWATVLVSSLYWGMAYLSSHQLRLSTERNSFERAENTVKALTSVNFLFCISQLIQVMMVTGSLNPYSVEVAAPDIRFPDVIFPYGQSSGDQIRGVFYDNHHNAIISQLCFVFFLFNRRYLFAALNFVIITLICFNLVTLTTVVLCAFLFFYIRQSQTKWFIAGAAVFIALFYFLVTPENISYLTNRINNSWMSVADNKDGFIKTEHHEKLRYKRQGDSLVADVDTTGTILVVDTSYNFDKASGKKISYSQTFRLMRSETPYMLFGCGAGMFSSKLANNFSGVFYGPTILNKNLPAPSYELFITNHGSLNKYLQKLEIGKHSINNFPNSVYNQLLSEYGILGVLLFAGFYVFFFIKQYRRGFTYGLFLIPLLLVAFNYGYYFESLDITVFFEFLVFIDLQRKKELQA